MEYLSFKLSDSFIDGFKDVEPDWGFPIGGGNTLGEITFLTKYSRLKEDGTKEKWYEVCRRCVEGYYSILKDHCKANNTPWNENKAQAAAQDAYTRMFEFKWLPPGRGLWAMGTPMVNAQRNSASLFNCAFLSTEFLSPRSEYEATMPFVRLMEMSMNGIGVGFDTMGAGKLTIHKPTEKERTFVVPDTREGWAQSVHEILVSYFFKNRDTVVFDYSQIRPKGAPIVTFGGVAAGPEPLERLHNKIREIFKGREGEYVTSRDIVDLMNLIGKAVVAGNVRRSAEIALGSIDDKDFVSIKDWNLEENSERMGPDGWGHLSNNTVIVKDDSDMNHILEPIAVNGEPGIFNIDLSRNYGRMIDGEKPGCDSKVRGLNPCAEITLEHSELCNLTETFPLRHESIEDYLKTLKHAYLYSKAVTILPTPWPETNEVITRNRRIGTSMSGVVQFIETHGWKTLQEYAKRGYEEIQRRDTQYSEWLGVRESIKTTTVKPSGTVSLLSGSTPGVHWPVTSGGYIRRQRFSASDPMVPLFEKAGYKVEESVTDKNDVVVEFYTLGPPVRNEREVSVWEKVALAALMQRYWADNAVSATFTFQPHEVLEIERVIAVYRDQLKTMSFLPLGEASAPGAYAQMPYEAVDENSFMQRYNAVSRIDTHALYSGKVVGDVQAEKYCTNDSCEI